MEEKVVKKLQYTNHKLQTIHNKQITIHKPPVQTTKSFGHCILYIVNCL